MNTGQQNLAFELGEVHFEIAPDTSKVTVADAVVNDLRAINGHCYLELVKDSRGNRFSVLFKVVTVDKASRYVAFIWRRLPGGKVVRNP
jgi:hypothetical protein